MRRKGIIFVEGAKYQSLREIRISKLYFDLVVVFVTEKLKYYEINSNENLKLSDHIISVDSISDIKKVAKLIPNDIDYVVCTTFWEYSLLPAAKLANLLKIPGLDLDTAEICRNKFRQRNIAKMLDIYQPFFHLYDLTKETAFFDKKIIKFPLIIKPIDGAGSTDVYKVDSYENLITILNKLKDDYHKNKIQNSLFIVEEYIEGKLVSAEVLACKGKFICLGIVSRILGGSSGCIELGGTFPSSCPHFNDIFTQSSQLLSAIGFYNGAAHIEYIIKDNKAYLVEINGRLAGAYVANMIDFSYECDIYFEIISIYVSGTFSNRFLKSPKFFSTLRALYSQYDGRLYNAEALFEFKSNEINFYKLLIKEGDSINALRNGFDRIGFFIVNDKNEMVSIHKADKYFKKINELITDLILTS